MARCSPRLVLLGAVLAAAGWWWWGWWWSLAAPVADASLLAPAPADGASAWRAAWTGGWTGAAAMAAQVLLTMWLRTVVNVQTQRGVGLRAALCALYREGGVARFYRGLAPALVLGPLSRFGAITSNLLALRLLGAATAGGFAVPLWVKTLLGAVGALLWRVAILPLDTLKTALQVHGAGGTAALRRRVELGGLRTLYHGAGALAVQSLLGAFCFFLVHNALSAQWPRPGPLLHQLARNGAIGFCAGAVGETAGNSLRVLKVIKQTSVLPVTYREIAGSVSAAGGRLELFTRGAPGPGGAARRADLRLGGRGAGLSVRLLSNGFQGVLFNILWKLLEDRMRDAPAA